MIEAPKALEEEWTTMVNEAAVTMSPFNERSYFFGSNIPGKARGLPAQLPRAAQDDAR